MRNAFAIKFIPIVAILLCASGNSFSIQNKTLLVIHSYQLDFGWTKGQDQGIQHVFEGFNHNNTEIWKIEKIFLDEKKSSQREIEKKIANAKNRINQNPPSAVITTDDRAFKEFYQILKDKGIPLSFTGLNGNIAQDYGYMHAGDNVSGTLERFNIKPVIKIVKRIVPEIKSILLVGEDSFSSKSMLKNYVAQLNENQFLQEVGISNLRIFESSSVEKLKEELSKVNAKNECVVFVAMYNYRDKNNAHIDYRQIDSWINAHTKFIDVGAATFNVESGRFISFAGSGFEMGQYAAKVLLIDSFRKEKKMSEIEIRSFMPQQLFFNHDRAKNINISIPYEIIVYSKNIKHLNGISKNEI